MRVPKVCQNHQTSQGYCTLMPRRMMSLVYDNVVVQVPVYFEVFGLCSALYKVRKSFKHLVLLCSKLKFHEKGQLGFFHNYSLFKTFFVVALFNMKVSCKGLVWLCTKKIRSEDLFHFVPIKKIMPRVSSALYKINIYSSICFWFCTRKNQLYTASLALHNFHQLGPVGHRVAMSVCLPAPSRNTHFRGSCRPLVKDRVPNIGLG